MFARRPCLSFVVCEFVRRAAPSRLALHRFARGVCFASPSRVACWSNCDRMVESHPPAAHSRSSQSYQGELRARQGGRPPPPARRPGCRPPERGAAGGAPPSPLSRGPQRVPSKICTVDRRAECAHCGEGLTRPLCSEVGHAGLASPGPPAPLATAPTRPNRDRAPAAACRAPSTAADPATPGAHAPGPAALCGGRAPTPPPLPPSSALCPNASPPRPRHHIPFARNAAPPPICAAAVRWRGGHA